MPTQKATHLYERNRRIVRAIATGRLTLEEIGELNALTRERVRQIGLDAGLSRSDMHCVHCGMTPLDYRHRPTNGDHRFFSDEDVLG